MYTAVSHKSFPAQKLKYSVSEEVYLKKLMAYWLIKSEPETWSWDDQCRKDVECWDGVRNHQAYNYMQQMRRGDLAFFYHSGKERAIVGIVEIVREAYPDPTAPQEKWCAVDVKTVRALEHPIALKMIKEDENLHNLSLVRQSRLSVMPIDAASWARLCEKEYS